MNTRHALDASGMLSQNKPPNTHSSSSASSRTPSTHHIAADAVTSLQSVTALSQLLPLLPQGPAEQLGAPPAQLPRAAAANPGQRLTAQLRPVPQVKVVVVPLVPQVLDADVLLHRGGEGVGVSVERWESSGTKVSYERGRCPRWGSISRAHRFCLRVLLGFWRAPRLGDGVLDVGVTRVERQRPVDRVVPLLLQHQVRRDLGGVCGEAAYRSAGEWDARLPRLVF